MRNCRRSQHEDGAGECPRNPSHHPTSSPVAPRSYCESVIKNKVLRSCHLSELTGGSSCQSRRPTCRYPIPLLQRRRRRLHLPWPNFRRQHPVTTGCNEKAVDLNHVALQVAKHRRHSDDLVDPHVRAPRQNLARSSSLESVTVEVVSKNGVVVANCRGGDEPGREREARAFCQRWAARHRCVGSIECRAHREAVGM